MLDVAVAYNRYRFLGNEFLTWLWFIIDTRQNELQAFDPELLALEIGNRIDLENRRDDKTERITIKGEHADLKEGYLALKKGALVTDLNLVFRSAELQWQFNIKGESLNISSLRTPDTGLPPIITSPLDVGNKPDMMLRIVLFPHPEGPRRVTNSPSFTSKCMFRRT